MIHLDKYPLVMGTLSQDVVQCVLDSEVVPDE